jgi:hypothetical protein
MIMLARLKAFILIISLFYFISNSVCYANDKNILLYLPFDSNCNSPITNDKPIIKGSLSFAPGKVGSALLIGGEQKALVEFQGTKYIDPKQGTITFWVKPVDWDSSKEPNASAFHFFRLLNNAFLYRVWKDSVSFYCNFPDDKVYQLYTAGLPLRKGQWAHVAVSWLDNNLKIYANGELAGNFMLHQPMRTDWQGKGIKIGETSNKKHTLMDEFYIFDYPLAASEIKQIYETSSKDKGPQLPEYKLFRVYLTHYPASSKAYICLDAKHASFSSSPVTAKIFLVNSQGQSLPLGTLDKFAAAHQRAAKLVDLPKNMSAGNYAISARILDAKGRELAATNSAPFEKRVYPWEKVNIGLSDEVIPPFTPLKIHNNLISCWGREYLFKGDGFPQTIMTRRAQILSGPVTLEASINGAHLNLGGELKVITQKPGVILLSSSSNHDCGRMDVTCRVEYDGMMLYHIKFIPNKKVTLDKLLVKIPIKNNNAKLYHVVRDAIRLNSESGYLPKGEGKIWGSSAKKSKDVLGTFIPYFWIGDYDRGFCWMANNDKDWSVPDGEDCVEFIRDKKALTAIVNFIKSPKSLSKPWEVTFALMAGPPRPEPEGWRGYKKWSDWFCGHAPTLQGYGKPPNFTKYLADVKNYKKVRGYWGVNTSPNDFWGVTEENKYFQLEWSGGVLRQTGYPLIHRNNFVMYTLDRLMSKGYIDGLYSDDTYPVPSNNLITGRGYIRPDGKIQSGYSMFALRDFFKRSAYLFRKHNCSRSMMVHMTDAMIMPCFSFWDIKNDNEWVKNKPGVRDHIDAWSLGEICARCMSRQYGMAAVWHSPATWKNSPESGGDDLVCLLLLHDILGRAARLKERTSPGKLLFGIGEPDVEFLGYWVLQPNNDPEKKDVKVSAWVRKKLGTALVVVANLSKQDWQGKIDLPLHVMGLNSHDVAYDAEGKANAPVIFDQGSLRLSIPHHNYRLLLIGPKGHFPTTMPSSETKLEKPKMNVRAPSRLKIGPPTFLKSQAGGEK